MTRKEKAILHLHAQRCWNVYAELQQLAEFSDRGHDLLVWLAREASRIACWATDSSVLLDLALCDAPFQMEVPQGHLAMAKELWPEIDTECEEIDPTN